jgi:hypothetical protein
MLPLISILMRRRALVASTTAALATATASTTASAAGELALPPPPPGVTLIAPGVYQTAIPVFLVAFGPLFTEAVTFSGTGRITTRLSTDPDGGNQVLLAQFDTTGIVGTGSITFSRYELSTIESLVLPHATTQMVSLTFPMVPTATSLNQAVRTGSADLTLHVDLATGAVYSMVSGVIRIL